MENLKTHNRETKKNNVRNRKNHFNILIYFKTILCQKIRLTLFYYIYSICLSYICYIYKKEKDFSFKTFLCNGEINPRYSGIKMYRGEKCILEIFILLPKMCYVFGKILIYMVTFFTFPKVYDCTNTLVIKKHVFFFFQSETRVYSVNKNSSISRPWCTSQNF